MSTDSLRDRSIPVDIAAHLPAKPIFGLWFGGSSYAPSYMDRDLEVFESVEDAKDAMSGRVRGHHFPATFTFADGRRENALTPCVEGSWMDLYFYDPREVTDQFPDLRLEQDEDDDIIEKGTA